MNHANSKLNHNVLIITTSGGGGHLQACNAKVLDEKLKNPSVNIIIKDILRAASGSPLIGLWDLAQRKGKVKSLDLLVSGIFFFDIIFWIPIYLHIITLLIKHNVDHVIDTQPLCLPSIVSALKTYNFFFKKTLYVEKFLTELPTNHMALFLKPIKRLRKKNRAFIKLMTTSPLLKNNETAELFWKKHSGLSEASISYGELPIRPHFKKYYKKEKTNEAISLSIHVKNSHEEDLLKAIFKKTDFEGFFNSGTLSLSIEPDAKVTTLMLGSQPTQQAILNYVQNFIDGFKTNKDSKQKHYFFIFCSYKKFEKISLQEQIRALVLNSIDYPKGLLIIPMSSQGDDVIAPLYFRSDATLTKSGGVTAMELLSVATGKIWIHQEDSSANLLQKLLTIDKDKSSKPCKGMPKWEYGNATYLEKIKGAEIITPETFFHASKNYL